ncbi:membrane protein insertion efficiency factor YidD [bacterium]|nr:membrane protein insertion efficiency factor YidD [bacterium]
MAAILLKLIRIYRDYISPLFPPRCRFYPSCSEYAQIAIQRFGAVRGAKLFVIRILKCHPWHAGGIDPVPND